MQRIVNSGGRVEREYGQGKKRIDLLVLWTVSPAPLQKIVLELKIQYGSLEKTITEGLKQTAKYMDICHTKEAHLVIFNRNSNVSWEDKIFCKESEKEHPNILIWGM